MEINFLFKAQQKFALSLGAILRCCYTPSPMLKIKTRQIQEEDRWAYANFIFLQHSCKSLLTEGLYSFETREILLLQLHIFKGTNIRY